MHTLDHQVFQFGSFRLDLTRGCVFDGDREIELRPKSFEVLRYLVENAGRLVSKDELIGRIWPNVIVNEDSLARCVSDVRQAVRDETQRIIKTVPRRGYLFTAPVSQGTDPTAADGVGPANVDDPTTNGRAATAAGMAPPASGRKWLWSVGGGALLLLVAIAVGMLPWRSSTGPALPDKPSIAVLPFKNLSGDPAQEYFSDGMTEELITSLSKFSGLFIIARESAFRYRHSHADERQIGRELGVRYLVEGSVRRDDDRVRISARLIDTENSANIWADSYDERMTGLFALQDEVARRITVTLVSHVTTAELNRSLRTPPGSMAAYDFYLQARAEMRHSIGLDHETQLASVMKARDLLHRSLEADPRFAGALAALAGTYVRSWRERLSDEYRQPSTLDRALEYGRQAVELDPYMAEAHAQLAYVLHWQYRRGEALREFERAFELNPNLADGRYGLMLIHNGRSAEAIPFIRRVMRLDPLHMPDLYSFLGNAYFLTGEYSNSLEMHRIAASRIASVPQVHVWHAAIAAQMDQMDEAHAAAATVLRLEPEFTISKFQALIRLADKKDAERLAAALRRAGLPD
jgi:TolB-like protein/DNA-binding winged helix-turn-helix (wHTH) protein